MPLDEEISRLSRLVILGGADIDRLESKLYDAVCSEKNRKISHESKDYLNDLNNSHSKQDISVSLLKLLHSWLEIALSTEQKSLTQVVDYIITTSRMAIAISRVIDIEDSNVEIIENFVNDLVNRSNNYTLFYFYWINLIHKNSEKTKEKALKIDPSILSVLKEKLIKELCSMAHYEGGIEKEHQTLLNKSLPPSLYLGPLDLFHEKSIGVIKDEVWSTRMKLYIGLLQWNEGSRANGLSSIASGCEYWLNELSSGISSSLGCDALMCLTSVISDITSNNLSPAHQFLEIMCDSLQTHPSSSMLHYIYYIYLDNSKESENMQRKANLLKKYPLLTDLKDAQFEQTVFNHTENLEERRNILDKFIKDKIYTKYVLNHLKSENESMSPKNTFPVSQKVQQELLDIELLQNMQEKKISMAVNTLTSSSEQNQYPSDVVTMLLVKNLYDANDIASLEKIRKSLTCCPGIHNDIYKAEIKLYMKNTYNLWKQGSRQLALEDSLVQYQSILNNQHDQNDRTTQMLLSSVVKYIKLFVEEICHDEDNLALDIVEKYAKECYAKFSDATLFVLQWETLFFSHKHSHHVLAREFLARNSSTIDNIDFTKVIGLAIKYKEEYFLDELFNISVEYELCSDTQIKSVTALIEHYVETSNHKALESCVNTAVQHKIFISSDLKEKIEKVKDQRKLYSKFMAYFKPPGKN